MTPEHIEGQTMLGAPCAWCGSPATREIEVQPKRMGKKKGEDIVAQQAIVVPACDDHRAIKDSQPPDVSTFRLRRAKGVEQLDIFGNVVIDGKPRQPTDAIRGEAA